MSHRAIVARPVDNDGNEELYDFYFSKNGANDLKLLPALHASMRKNREGLPISEPEVPDDITTEIDHILASHDENIPDRQLMESEPFATEIPVTKFGDNINYLMIEAVYRLKPDGAEPEDPSNAIDLLLPIFVDVGVVSFFARFIDLEVYKRSNLPAEPKKALNHIQKESVVPENTLSGSEYLVGDLSSEGYQAFTDTHLGILQALYDLVQRGESMDHLVTIVTEDLYVVGRLKTQGDIPLPEPHGSGILVEMPTSELDRTELVSLYENWRTLTNRLRVAYSVKAAAKVIKNRSESEDNLTQVDIEQMEDPFVKELYDEFSSSISPLSPEDQLASVNTTEK